MVDQLGRKPDFRQRRWPAGDVAEHDLVAGAAVVIAGRGIEAEAVLRRHAMDIGQRVVRDIEGVVDILAGDETGHDRILAGHPLHGPLDVDLLAAKLVSPAGRPCSLQSTGRPVWKMTSDTRSRAAIVRI